MDGVEPVISVAPSAASCPTAATVTDWVTSTEIAVPSMASGERASSSHRWMSLPPTVEGETNCLNHIGDLLKSQGDRDGAIGAYQQNLEIVRTFATKEPDVVGPQLGLLVGLINIGDVLSTKGDLAGALAAYRERLGILRQLSAKDPTNTSWQRDLAVNLNRVGDVLKAQSDMPGAQSAYGESLDIFRGLSVKDPGNTLWQTDLSFSLGRLAAVGDDPPGRLREALAILTRLKGQGRLPRAQDTWIGVFEADLAKLSGQNRAVPPTFEQIQGTYKGVNISNQVPGGHQISLTFLQAGQEVTATYQSSLGAKGRGRGIITGNVIGTMALQNETPQCAGSYTAAFWFSNDTVSWTYRGQDCSGPAQGRGSAEKIDSPVPSAQVTK